MGDNSKGHRSGRFLGSLKDALAAASREDTEQVRRREAAARAANEVKAETANEPLPLPPPEAEGFDTDKTVITQANEDAPVTMSAAEAAREARGGNAPNVTAVRTSAEDQHVEFDTHPTTNVVKAAAGGDGPAPTKMVRGKQQVKRGNFEQDPVVGWLVVVGGPGIGSFRPIFEGNNSIGRSASQRIALDFGDDAISSEEQAFIRYDSSDRSFLFVPNLSKTNIVSINDKRPTGAVELAQMDVIVMGRTQLVFVPFCGAEFDWSELSEA